MLSPPVGESCPLVGVTPGATTVGCSPTILVFAHQMGWQYSDEDPSNGGVECKGDENKNLAIGNRSRVSCAHNTLRAFVGLNITP